MNLFKIHNKILNATDLVIQKNGANLILNELDQKELRKFLFKQVPITFINSNKYSVTILDRGAA